ncbi:MAG: site-2 protease family protein [Oscillospiraceae bacterium]|nr:site-2 protease family protein [Oscillospiraceae bacterium]
MVIAALLSFTFHELSHGFVAYKLGDDTAKNAGRLTLNPIKHIDVVGLILIIVSGFGWAKPVPINMNNFKKPKEGMAISALAGPVSNLLLAAVALLIFGFVAAPLGKAGSAGDFLLQLLYTTAYINCVLAVFNIIPIPPLDGSKVLFSLLPEREYYKLMQYERYGMIILLILVVTHTITPILTTGVSWVFDVLLPIARWSASLVA